MFELTLSAHQAQARDAILQQLAAEQAAARLWQRDAGLWYPAPETQARIRQRLGWLDLPTDAAVAQQIEAVQRAMRERGAKQIVYVAPGVLGRAVRLWLSLVEPRPDQQIKLIDTVEAGAVAEVLALCDQVPTLVVHAGPFDTPQARALAAVLPADLLVPLPPNTGERFGALTVPALLPAALHGLDWRAMLQQLHEVDKTWRDLHEAAQPAFQLGAALSTFAQAGRDLLYLLVPPEQEPLVRWLEALVGGALGKHRRGLVPFVNHAVIPQQVEHSIVVQIGDARTADLDQVGVPIIRCPIQHLADIAEFVWTWQLAVAVAAMVIGLNPFDAPDADVINARIAQQVDQVPTSSPFTPNDRHRSVQQARFLALAAYLPTSFAPQLEQIRTSVSTALNIPVTLLFPLRDWLWELQLLHAGRPDGAILVLSADGAPDQDPRLAPIHALQQTQVAVELDTWRRMGRPAAHVRSNDATAAILDDLLSDLIKS